jgi:hypothetical protein
MFNEIQVRLLTEARKRIEDEIEHFICCSLNSVTNTISESLYSERRSNALSIKEDIGISLDNLACLEVWLFTETGIYPENIRLEVQESWDRNPHEGWKYPVARETFMNWCRMARLAWIDRMLETGEIA